MNRPAMLMLVCALAGATVCAEIEIDGDGALAVMKVPAATTETIIAVPWVSQTNSAADADIPIAELVHTGNLSTGDEIWYYDTAQTTYKVWRLLADKTWEAAVNVGSTGVTAASDTPLKRGDAFFLKRKSAAADAVYLCGQLARTSSVTTTMGQGATSASYTLFAPPGATATCINDGAWSGVAANDRIIIGGAAPFYWNAAEQKWGHVATNAKTFQQTWSDYDAAIPLGQGAWYCSEKGAATQASVRWEGLPTK